MSLMRGKILMSQEQIKRYMAIHKSQEGQISVQDAATTLNLSVRQVIRLRKWVNISGAQALIHKNQGRPPARKTTEEVIKAIINHKSSDKYKDSNFKHFQELLAKHEKIEVSYSLIHKLLTEAGIPSPKKRRRFKPYRRRNRKAQEGLLIQIELLLICVVWRWPSLRPTWCNRWCYRKNRRSLHYKTRVLTRIFRDNPPDAHKPRYPCKYLLR